MIFIVWAGCMDCYLLYGLDAWTIIYCVGWMIGLLFIVWDGCMDCYLLCELDAWSVIYFVVWMH